MWLNRRVVVRAFMRRARDAWSSALTTRSSVVTRYHDGLTFQATVWDRSERWRIAKVQRSPNRCSCSVQLKGRERTSPLTVTPAGTSPLAITATMRGDRNASGARKRMWRATFCSRSAISSND